MKIDAKKVIIKALPFVIMGLFATKLGQAYRLSDGIAFSDKLTHIGGGFTLAFQNSMPSFHHFDLLIGAACGGIFKAVFYFKGKNAKKFRKDIDYGSARWDTPAYIKPYTDEKPVIQTIGLTMNSRPKLPKYTRNKNVLVMGGSGSGKTRFFVKPIIMQCQSKVYPVSFVVTDPKETILEKVGKLLQKNGYKIKVLNVINFKRSMKYNPFAYIRSEKDILKFVTALIANTKGDGKGGDDF